ncbi:hypothetical protein F5I97DRAFT_1828089 [Phlebopus sp. FC_14]|nr:hypothetical protein F5I97DRAFT_1828089 [Phlebopus sp. FC_14]
MMERSEREPHKDVGGVVICIARRGDNPYVVLHIVNGSSHFVLGRVETGKDRPASVVKVSGAKRIMLIERPSMLSGRLLTLKRHRGLMHGELVLQCWCGHEASLVSDEDKTATSSSSHWVCREICLDINFTQIARSNQLEWTLRSVCLHGWLYLVLHSTSKAAGIQRSTESYGIQYSFSNTFRAFITLLAKFHGKCVNAHKVLKYCRAATSQFAKMDKPILTHHLCAFWLFPLKLPTYLIRPL